MAKKHPGSIEKRGDSYRLRLCVNGERHYFTLDCTKNEIEDFAWDKYNELRKASGQGLPGPMPFSDLLESYRRTQLPQRAPNSRKAYETSLSAFETYFVTQGGDPGAHEITRGHVRGFMDWRRVLAPDGTKCDPLSARTVAKDRVVLHIVFTYAEDLEIVKSNPVAKTDPPPGDSREPIILKPSSTRTSSTPATSGRC